VLHAIDDLVVELGYGAVTLKAVAERAGVSRQTIYRWWSTKAEILLEATVVDARKELTLPAQGSARDDLAAYLEALITFLTRSDAGIAYRALVGEAQHDSAVRDLLRGTDPLGGSAEVVIARSLSDESRAVPMPEAIALLVGPVFFWLLSGRDPRQLSPRALADAFLGAAGVPAG
jgi:AcrR family transcriptional regulator